MKEYTFYENVYDVVGLIPKGRVTTYGSIANYLGSKQSARMVGWALNSTRGKTSNLPVHRVVNRVGMLTGKKYFLTPDKMRNLLEKEGMLIKGDQIINFMSYFWDPSLELKI